MTPFLQRIGLLITLMMLLVATPGAAHESQAAMSRKVFLPMVSGPPLPPSPFGFDLRSYYDDTVLQYARQARPKWVRAGDVLWADIEATRGVYNWDVMAEVEANVRRVRNMGFEPVLVVQRSPAWAQTVPGRLCSAPRSEYAGDFARFMHALASRYATGPAAIHYWEIWNEPDFAPHEVQDSGGFGCWATTEAPFYGGDYYGAVLKRIYPEIKAANPRATVIGGALMYFWPDDRVSRGFLHGMLASGAAGSIDALSFHAYGEWGAGDLLVNKTIRIREILAIYGVADKPLFATEISAICYTFTSCPDNFVQMQANYAARIYAEAIALNLFGALWFTLVIHDPRSILYAQLIDDQDGKLTPRPAYYAFRNSAVLLQGAKYIGGPVVEPPPEQIAQVQILPFRKSHSTLYVLWVPKTDFPSPYVLHVKPGSRAICTQQLDRNKPARYFCSDTNNDGEISLAIISFPQYVEVFD